MSLQVARSAFGGPVRAEPIDWSEGTQLEGRTDGDGPPGNVAPAIELQAAVVTRMSDVAAERVSWLWPGRLPLGKLVVLDGDPSLGKSTLSLTFAAVVTTGGVWPDGSRCHHAGGVVLLSAEDGLADTVRPRLDAAGADSTKVVAIEGVRLSDKTVRPLSLADIEHLRKVIVDNDARLLIVDVLMAFLPSGTDSHRDQDVRRVLHRLVQVADDTGCTALLLRHLNKARGGDPLYRGGGSIGIVGAARAGLLVATDPDDDGRRILASTKSNLGPPPPSLAYRLTDSPDHGCARVEWDGQVAHNAWDLLAEHDTGEERTGGDEAVEWLTMFLTDAGGEAPAGDVLKAAARDGISKTTLHRARKRAGVVTTKGGLRAGWIWRLDPAGRFAEGSEESVSPELEPSEPSAESSRCVDCGRSLDPALGDATTHPTCSPGKPPVLQARTKAAIPTPAELFSSRSR
jgi:putative DNA primase/helicase